MKTTDLIKLLPVGSEILNTKENIVVSSPKWSKSIEGTDVNEIFNQIKLQHPKDLNAETEYFEFL